MPRAKRNTITVRRETEQEYIARAKRHFAEREAQPIDLLPFVHPGDDVAVRSYWAPRPSGDYVFDCSLGERYGEALLPLLRGPMGVQVLRDVVLDMVEHGDAARDRGLIVGMMGVLGAVVAGVAA